MNPGPRLFGLTAAEKRKVVVIRRGPSEWSHAGVWDLDTDDYIPGSWFHGVIYPQKCDVSPDGRWLVYSAMKHPGEWAAGSIYEAVSRVPWLTTLAAWESGTTYTRGLHFTTGSDDPGTPDIGEYGPLLDRYGLAWTRPVQFAVERRRGWHESADSPPREHGGPWDERRSVTMVKAQPTGSSELWVEGEYAAFRSGEPDPERAVYSLVTGDDIQILGEAQWADWDAQGDLLVATWGGVLQRIRGDAITDVVDLSLLRPNPQPPPGWASEW